MKNEARVDEGRDWRETVRCAGCGKDVTLCAKYPASAVAVVIAWLEAGKKCGECQENGKKVRI